MPHHSTPCSASKGGSTHARITWCRRCGLCFLRSRYRKPKIEDGTRIDWSGEFSVGGQDISTWKDRLRSPRHAKMIAACWLRSSTQHPTEVQNIVAHALGLSSNQVIVQCRRMGGGFGGKESQAALIAAAAAVLAGKTGRPVKLRLDRDTDMAMTGKRHDFIADYEAGFDDTGRLLALSVMLASRCGYSADLSGPVNDRAMFHVDNAYYLEHVEITSHRCKTHTVSNTAFRGFGGPQGMMVIEAVIDDIARTLNLDPLEVRRANLYGIGERNVTHYGQLVEGNSLPRSSIDSSAAANTSGAAARSVTGTPLSPFVKRGLALTPVKFGISFTATLFNQAGALLQIYTDGTVLLNHGGTEMGQGLHVKVAQVVATRAWVAALRHPHIGDGYQQGAEHLRHRRLLRRRSQRQGGAGGRHRIRERLAVAGREVRRYAGKVRFHRHGHGHE